MFSEDFIKFDVYFAFFCFSFLSFLFSLKLNFAFFLTLESLNDFPLYLFDILTKIYPLLSINYFVELIIFAKALVTTSVPFLFK